MIVKKWFFTGSRIQDREVSQLGQAMMLTNERLTITKEVKDAIEENIRDKMAESIDKGIDPEAARAAVFARYPAHARIANGEVVEPAFANVSLFKDGY